MFLRKKVNALSGKKRLLVKKIYSDNISCEDLMVKLLKSFVKKRQNLKKSDDFNNKEH